jgi:hypothetical protein
VTYDTRLLAAALALLAGAALCCWAIVEGM